MSQIKPFKFKPANLLIIFMALLLSSNSSLVNTQTDFLITEEIETCVENTKGSQILKFTSKDYQADSEQDSFDIQKSNDNENEYMVTLKKPQLNDKFTLELKLGSQKIQVSGSFVKSCEESYTSPCTIIIAFLASLCLILFTALALALIILRRKKPITFKFGQREDRESIQYDSGKSYNETNYEETFEQSNKIESTIDVTANNILIGAKAVSKDSPSLTSMPRKSSLKPPKTNFSDQLNNNGIYENAAYTGGELDVVHEVSEDKPIDEKPVFQEGRRKSIVTFSETTQVKFG